LTEIVLYEERCVSRKRDREASVEHLLRRMRQERMGLPPVGPGAWNGTGDPPSHASGEPGRSSKSRAWESSPVCLDAETLAAWSDGALTGDELAAAEAHASNCSHCQALLAAMTRTSPAPATAEGRWWSGLAVRWLVPLTAAATAVAIWVAVPRNEPPPVPVLEDGRQQATVAPSSQEPATRFDQPPASADAVRELQAPRVERLNKTKDRQATPAREQSEAGNEKAQLQDRDAADTVRRAAEPTSARPPAAAGAAAEAARARPPAAAAAAAGARSESTLDKTAQSLPQTFSAANAIAIEIASPDPSIRWRVGAGGSVQYSTNGGATWEALSTGVSTDLTAGASPSPSICWLVGRAGTVLLSTDGRRWQRLSFPEPTDLVQVRATNARTASVTSADGRTFRTTNGGLTWDR
jgi:hypothetical protein